MFAPYLHYNNFTTKSTVMVPRLITIFFLMWNFLCGLDFGFANALNKKFQSFIKAILTVLSLMVFIILAIPLNGFDRPDYCWYITVFLEFTCFLFLFKFSKYTLYDFLLEMHTIDKKIQRVNKLTIGLLLWVYFCFWYFVKMILEMFVICVYYLPDSCDVDYIPYPLYSLPGHGIDFMFIVPILIYSYLYSSLKDVNELLINELSISHLKMRYVAITNCYNKIRPSFEKLICLELLETPKMMALIYNMLKYYVEDAGIAASLGEYLYSSNIISNIVCLGVMGQMVVYQVDALKVQLHKMLLDEKDGEKSEEIQRILGYINARRLCRPVAGVIPVDMSLVTTAFSVFATYMIVIVQLSHIVD